jgi:ParB-like chromosome segregation protein Spo0J
MPPRKKPNTVVEVRPHERIPDSGRVVRFNAEDIEKQPVSHVTWLHRSLLLPNDYNPNHVAPPELELLIISILEDGWTQPIVILPSDREEGKFDIVDGFHRYKVSGDPRLMERTQGYVPTVQVKADPVHRKMSTIRHNRARGTHGVLPMATIVQSVLADGTSKEDVMSRLQMEQEEVDRLTDRAGMPDQVARDYRDSFGTAWEPTDKNNRRERG